MKKIVTPILCLAVLMASAQSIVQEQKAFFDKYHYTNENDWDKLQEQISVTEFKRLPESNLVSKGSACNLNGRRVYGWHPYWNGSMLHNNYQWNLLSDLCYFDYTITPASGANSNVSFAWNTSAAVTAAKSNGVKISFCATLFSFHSTFLTSSPAKNTFIQNVITLLRSRGGNGVCIDFESMPATQKVNFVSFIQVLSKKIHDSIPGGELALSLPAVDWNGVFDIPNLKNYADLFIIMGYDYYYGGSSTAGPTDPLYPFQTSFNYGLSRSVSYYLDQGVPKNKLLMGVPYYGRQYQTAGSSIPSANAGGSASSSTPVYKAVRVNSNGDYSASNKRWDPSSFSPYYVFQKNGLWYQCFIDDSFSISKRYDILNQRGLAGIGIWTLGYDDGYTELWNAISNNLTSCYSQPCADTLFDMGGPARNYNDKETYVYTISPPAASIINLKFSQFDLEANYDSLWLYDGPGISSALIGRYTGTNSPGNINLTGSSLTMRFKSDGATNLAGYKAVYTCQLADLIPPVTKINVPLWVTGNFTAAFTDTDVGKGIQLRFYSAEEYSALYGWRANKSNGFFNDAFDGTAVHSDWTKQSGSWMLNANTLYQSDQSNSNTNLYTSLMQNSDQILYHWIQKISGTGLNRRAGLHFMCSAASGNGRGNSYLVMARVDGGGKLQIYKYVNDVMYLNADITYPFMANTNYDLKVIYNKTNGKISVFVNNVLAGSWSDSTGLSSGAYVCFRSGECLLNIDNFEVLKSRTGNSKDITVGLANSNDIRTQNLGAASAGGRIRSIVTDGADLFSATAIQPINIDYTIPSAVGTVRDGLTATDIPSTTDLDRLSANWNASGDAQSGILKYRYAIGTTPGGTDILNWTDNGTDTFVTRTGLILLVGNTYFFSVKAENAAGLQSAAVNSNGQQAQSPFPWPILRTIDTSRIFQSSLTSNDTILKSFEVFPNPVNSVLQMNYTLNKKAMISLSIVDMSGRMICRIVKEEWQNAGNYTYEYAMEKYLQKGMYLLILKAGPEGKQKIVAYQ